MIFDFDPAKSEQTLTDRGFDFAYAALIFEGHTVERADDRFWYEGEERVIAIGQVGTDPLTVVFTWRTDEMGDVLRWIISARRSSRKERRIYAAYFPG